MADYDVGALALVVPATSGPKSTYRPAVSVRNNGIHDAIASGYLRIYAAGLLVFETELYSATITPGATGLAQAVDYWTPSAEGQYTIHAYLSTPLDQVESNNMLAPVTITITGETPPTPPVVAAHAAQHEEGGTDEVSIDGLKGRAADPQDALAHAASHQAGGSDALNVGSLQGILAQDQPTQVHSNTRHNPVMSTAAELTAHAGSVAAHTAATNLANRDTTGPETGLVTITQLASGSAVPASLYHGLRVDRLWAPTKHASIGYNRNAFTQLPGSGRQHILEIAVPEAYITDDMQLVLETSVEIVRTVGNAGTVTFSTWLDATVLSAITANLNLEFNIYALMRSTILAIPTSKISTNMLLSGEVQGSAPTPFLMCDPGVLLRNRPAGPSIAYLDVEFDGDGTDRSVIIYSGHARALSPIA